MPRLAVIFDANIYRQLGWTEFLALLARERQHSVVGYASFWTCMELLAHLADPNDPHFGPSWQAVRRLVQHCTEYDGSRRLVRFIADSENHIGRTLFERSIPGRAEQAIQYGQLLGEVCDARTVGDLAPLNKDLCGIRDHVKATEQSFSQAIFTNVVQALVPSATAWDAIARDKPQSQALQRRLEDSIAAELVGSMFVVRSAAQLGLELSADEIRHLGRRVADIFSAPVCFYLEVLRRIARTGYDMSRSKNANSVWDLQFAFSTSPFAVLGRMPLWVVSRDRLVLTSAEQAGARKWFMHPDMYQARLALQHDEFSVAIEEATPK